MKNSGDTTQQTVITLDNIQTYDYDIDDTNLYVYATQGSNTYLYSINLNNVLEDESFEQKLLGVYAEGDVPEAE